MNRLATENDIAQYGAKFGDVIIDTPNKPNANGSKALSYYFMGTEWPLLKGDTTFWFDGDKLGYLTFIKFQNTVDELPWPCETVRFRTIPGTKVKAGSMSVKGMKNFELIRSKPIIPNWDLEGKFLTGNFDFHLIVPTDNGLGYDISVQPGGSIIMRGFEGQHGFTPLRLQQKNEKLDVETLILEDFYLHDTYKGEGIYAGSTQTPPIPHFKNVQISNGIIARTAAEGIQLQHLAGADIHNLTIYAADTAWLNAFQPYQDTGVQFKAGGGINKFRNCIVDGYGSIGFNAFSTPDFVSEDQNEVLVEDVLFFNGRGIGGYFNTDCNKGVEWRFKNVYFGGFNNSYYDGTGNKLKPYIFSKSDKATDKIVLESIIYDGSKLSLCENASRFITGELKMQAFPAPQYINSGFTEQSSQIMQWRPYYAPYFEGLNTIPVKYYPGEITIDTSVGGYAFYKCKLEHIASLISPVFNPLYWEKLTWDENGIRSDQKGFISSYSTLPPDDLRLIGNNWKHMGIQVRENILEEYYINGKRITITNLNRYES